MKKKLLTIGIILFFIGIAVAPSINFSVVKASNDNNLVEVTTQACGIQGYGNATVRLTREQYNNLEQYLVEFRARLNQTTTREEAVPIFKKAVVELNKYGLLPRGMSVERAQKLVVGKNLDKKLMKPQEKILHNHLLTLKSNFLCLVAGDATNVFGVHWVNLLPDKISEMVLLGFYANIQFLNFVKYIYPDLFNIVLRIIETASKFFIPLFERILEIYTSSLTKLQNIIDWNPIALFCTLGFGRPWINSVGEVYSIGLLGLKKWEGEFQGHIGHIPLWSNGYIMTYPGIMYFNGMKLLVNNSTRENWFLGSALAVSLDVKQ